MICDICEQSPCTCQKMLGVQAVTMTVGCSTPGCFSQIKLKIADYQTADLRCRWCQEGRSHAMQGKTAIDPRLKKLKAV